MMVEQWLIALTTLVVPIIDLIALVFISAGTVEAAVTAAWVSLSPQQDQSAARAVWLRYSRWLIAGLTFQLAADILETSVTPTWEEIGQIGAIAVIRTFLNYFLERDQQEVSERQHEAEGRAAK